MIESHTSPPSSCFYGISSSHRQLSDQPSDGPHSFLGHDKSVIESQDRWVLWRHHFHFSTETAKREIPQAPGRTEEWCPITTSKYQQRQSLMQGQRQSAWNTLRRLSLAWTRKLCFQSACYLENIYRREAGFDTIDIGHDKEDSSLHYFALGAWG